MLHESASNISAFIMYDINYRYKYESTNVCVVQETTEAYSKSFFTEPPKIGGIF